MAGAALLKDTKYPGMYCIRYEDGELSDMYNKTWAKEHLRKYQETRPSKTPRERRRDLHPAGGFPSEEKEGSGLLPRTSS